MNKPIYSIRTNYIINPAFQYRFILYFIFIGLISLGIFYAANLFFFRKLMAEGFQLGLPATHVYFQLLNSQKTLMNQIFLITSVIFFFVISLIGVFISHRIAGPIYKMTKSLNQISNINDLNEIHFRKRDFFKELSEAFNRFSSRIK